MKLTAHEIRPEPLPQAQDIRPLEFTLVPDEQHAEEEEEVGRVGGLEVQVELGVHELDKVVKGEELGTHTGLIAEEVALLVVGLVFRECLGRKV